MATQNVDDFLRSLDRRQSPTQSVDDFLASIGGGSQPAGSPWQTGSFSPRSASDIYTSQAFGWQPSISSIVQPPISAFAEPYLRETPSTPNEPYAFQSPFAALQRQVDATIAARETSQNYATLPKRVADVINVYKDETLARQVLDEVDNLKFQYPDYADELEKLMYDGHKPDWFRTYIDAQESRKQVIADLIHKYPNQSSEIMRMDREKYRIEDIAKAAYGKYAESHKEEIKSAYDKEYTNTLQYLTSKGIAKDVAEETARKNADRAASMQTQNLYGPNIPSDQRVDTTETLGKLQAARKYGEAGANYLQKANELKNQAISAPNKAEQDRLNSEANYLYSLVDTASGAIGDTTIGVPVNKQQEIDAKIKREMSGAIDSIATRNAADYGEPLEVGVLTKQIELNKLNGIDTRDLEHRRYLLKTFGKISLQYFDEAKRLKDQAETTTDPAEKKKLTADAAELVKIATRPQKVKGTEPTTGELAAKYMYGQLKGMATGASMGILTPYFNKAEELTGGRIESTGLPQQLAQMGGGLASGVLIGGPLQQFYKSGMPQFLGETGGAIAADVATFGTMAAVPTYINLATEISDANKIKDVKERERVKQEAINSAASHMTAAILAGLLRLPIAANVPGRTLNAASQVMGYFASDLASESAFTNKLKDEGFAKWLIDELPSLAIAGVFAGIDFTNATRARKQIRDLYNKKISSGEIVAPTTQKAQTTTEIAAAPITAETALPTEPVERSKLSSEIELSPELRAKQKEWDFANRSSRPDRWFDGANERSAQNGFNDAANAGAEILPAHGMSKERTLGSAIKNLTNLLINGIDPNRGGGELYYGPLASKTKGAGAGVGTASGTAYNDGPFILVGRPGQNFTGKLENVAAILVNEAHADLVSLIRSEIHKIRPDIIVEPYSNAGYVTKNILKNYKQPVDTLLETFPANIKDLNLDKLKENLDKLPLSKGYQLIEKVADHFKISTENLTATEVISKIEEAHNFAKNAQPAISQTSVSAEIPSLPIAKPDAPAEPAPPVGEVAGVPVPSAKIEDLDIEALKASLEGAGYSRSNMLVRQVADKFGIPTSGMTWKQILQKIEENYNAAKERQVAEGGVGQYRGDGARIQKEGQDRIIQAGVPQEGPEAGGGYRPQPGGVGAEGQVGRVVSGEVTPTPEAPEAGAQPVAAPAETAPGYMEKRQPVIDRAKELRLDTTGTTAEIAARIVKKEEVVSFWDRVEQGARARIEELRKGGTMGANKPIGLAFEYTLVGAAKIGRGVQDFGKWSAEMIAEFGDKVKPYLREIFNNAKSASRMRYADEEAAIKHIESISKYKGFEEPVAQPSMVEPGTAEPAPVKPVPTAEPTLTRREVGLRNELSQAERKEFDMNSPPPRELVDLTEAYSRAKDKLANDPGAGKRLTEEVIKDRSRNLNVDESALLLKYKKQVSDEIDSAYKARESAKSESEISDADARLNSAISDYEQIINAAESSGSQWGATGVMRQMVAKEDYSLARMITKARAVSGERGLSKERQARVVEQNRKIEEIQSKIDALQETSTTVGISKVVSKEKAKNAAGSKTFDQQPPVRTDRMGKSIKDLARYFVSQGVTDRTDLVNKIHEVVSKYDSTITTRDVADAFSDYGKFRPLSKDEVDVKLRDLRQQLQQVSKLEDMASGKAPQKTGGERQQMSDEGRRLVQQVNEAKRRGGYDVVDPERQLASSMQTIKRRLENQIADLEHQINTRTKISRDPRRIEYDAEANALKARRDELRKQYDQIFPKETRPALTDAQRVKIAIDSVNRSIEELTQRIKTGNLFPGKKVSNVIETPELAAVRAEREALREQLKELQLIARPRKTAEEISNQAYKTRLKNQIAELERMRAEKDFIPKEKPERIMDKEMTDLQYKLAEARGAFNKDLADYKWENYSTGKKIWETTKDVFGNLTRALITAIDLPTARQGGIFLASRPITSIKIIPDAIRAMISEKHQFRVMNEIKNRPTYDAMKRAGLEISDPTAPGAKIDEAAFQGRLTSKLPKFLGGGIIRGSQRAYETYMTKLRADVFDVMSKTLSKTGSPTKVEQAEIANMINVFTGRAAVTPEMAKSLSGASTIFFAPRYAISRFQVLLGQPLMRGLLTKGGTTGTARAKKMIAAEYARALGGLASVYGLVVLRNELADEKDKWTVESDPRSSDFGKIKIGNTRIDPMAGISQATVFLSRIVTGETKGPAGIRVLREAGRPLNLFREDTDPLKTAKLEFGKSDIRATINEFMNRKLSPIATIPINIAAQGRMFERRGESTGYGPIEIAQDLIIPLSVRDIYQAMLDQGIPAATAYAMLAFFGISTQNYQTKEKKPTVEDVQKMMKNYLPELKLSLPKLKTL